MDSMLALFIYLLALGGGLCERLKGMDAFPMKSGLELHQFDLNVFRVRLDWKPHWCSLQM